MAYLFEKGTEYLPHYFEEYNCLNVVMNINSSSTQSITMNTTLIITLRIFLLVHMQALDNKLI